MFAGYQGEPRAFELIALGGFGWEHAFDHLSKTNGLNSKIALDFAFNLGADKAWQFYIEPALTYNLHSWSEGVDAAVVDAFWVLTNLVSCMTSTSLYSLLRLV